jgi:hypothetical protein
MLKLPEMAECRITDTRESLGMSHFRNIYAQDTTPQLLCQVARRPPGPAPNIQHGRPGRDPGSAREGKDFVGGQHAFLPNVSVAVRQRCRREGATTHRIVEASP